MPPQLNRLFIIFGFLAIAFVTVRYVARPKSFYEFGHYRGDALKEATLKSPHYVPRAQCADCHDEETCRRSEHGEYYEARAAVDVFALS